MKEAVALAFLILEFIFNHIFGRQKDKLFCPVFLLRKGMSNVICDLKVKS